MTNQPNKNPEKKLFVLDTNVILYDCNCIRQFAEHDVCILTIVLQELDTFKKYEDSKGTSARSFHRKLKELSAITTKKKIGFGKHQPEREVPALAHGGVSLGEKLGKIEIMISKTKLAPVVRDAFNDTTADNQILSKVFELQTSEAGKRRVILVTKDMNLHFKAQAIGVEVEDYESGKVPEIDELYVGRLKVEDASLAPIIINLYKTHRVRIFDGKNSHIITQEMLKPNMYFILSDGKNTVLARVDKNMEYFQQVEKTTVATIKSLNSEQAFAVNALLDEEISLITFLGKAGTGKTLLAIAAAIQQLKDRKYDKIIISSAMVTMGNKDMGALPGDAIEKVLPYMNGLHNNIEIVKNNLRGGKKHSSHEDSEAFSKKSKKAHKMDEREKDTDYVSIFQKEKKIEIQPLAYIRGSTFNNAFFIIDECQNLTPKEAKTIITRAGDGTKVVLCGDVQQIDSPYLDARSNGLSHAIYKFAGQQIYAHMTFVKGERSILAELAADLM